jgi:hypothetical protein
MIFSHSNTKIVDGICAMGCGLSLTFACYLCDVWLSFSIDSVH